MKTDLKDTICPSTGRPCTEGCFDEIRQICKKHDTIKQMAETELGHPIPDEYWTHEVRDFYKQFFHARNYGFSGTFGMVRALDLEDWKKSNG